MTTIKIILGALLLAALVAAGWNVYRRLPPDDSMTRRETYNRNASSELTVIFHRNSGAQAVKTQVELYPIDFVSMQRDFFSAVRPGKTFDDFMAQQLKGLAPVRAPLDDQGRAIAKLSEGNWWLRATTALASGEQVEWRLPLIVSGQRQTIELSAENAYERTKKF